MKWFLYLAECQDKSIYTGVSADVDRRLREHNSGKGGDYTRTKRPLKLIYVEPASSRDEALKRESQIKRWARRKKLALASGDKELLKLL